MSKLYDNIKNANLLQKTKCTVCGTSHSVVVWVKAYRLSDKGRTLATDYFNKEVGEGYCCNKQYHRLLRNTNIPNLEKKKRGRPEEIITKSNPKKQKETTSVPLKESFQLLQQNPHQTLELHYPDLGIKSTLQLKSNAETISRKQKQKIASTKLLPLSNVLLKNTNITETSEILSSIRPIQKASLKSKQFESSVNKATKNSISKTTKTLKKRNQLMSVLATHGTNVSQATLKTINIINGKQTNTEKIKNNHIKSPFSRIRKCFRHELLISYICDNFDSDKFTSPMLLSVELLRVLKSRENDALNTIGSDQYKKIVLAVENQTKKSINRDIPSILKYIYIEKKISLVNEEKLLEVVEEKGGIDVVEREGVWLEISKLLQLNSKFSDDLCRLSYYHFKKQLPPIKVFQRRLVDLGNIVMPYANPTETRQDLKSLCIGQETDQDDDESLLYTNDEWCKSFENPLAVYIGRPIKMPISLNGKDILVNGVVRDIAPVLIQHIVQCYKRGYIKKHGNILIKLVDWMDGTSILNKSLVKTSIHVLWDPELFEESSYDFVTRSLPLIYVWCSETKENVATMSTFLRKQYISLKTFSWEYENNSHSFKPRFMSADYSNASKRWNHKVGGDHRCTKCDISFKVCDHCDYAQCIKLLTDNKSLKNLVNKKQFENGQQGLPHVINDDQNMTLEERGFDEYENASEILHVTKGIASSMFTLVRKEPDFLESDCLAAFDEIIRQGAIAGTMSNGDWRIAFCKFEECILPFISHEQKMANLLLLYWRDIVRFLYSRKNKTLIEKQQFCVKVFVFGCLAVNRWGKNIVGLHFHDLWIHISKLIWIVDLCHVSAEKDEQLFSKEKKIAKNNTNHKQETVIVEIIRKSVLGEIVRENFKSKYSQRSVIDKILKDVSITPAIIPQSIITHPIYSTWVDLFENNILKPNFPEFQKFEFKGHFVHGFNEEVPPLVASLLDECILSKVVILKGKSKCSKCTSSEILSEKCLTGCCIGCCEEEGCVYHNQKRKANLKKAKKVLESLQSKSQNDTQNSQANSSQDVPTLVISSEHVNTTPPPKEKSRCSHQGCKNTRVARNCSNLMCASCCRQNIVCDYHKVSKSKKTSKQNSETIAAQTTTLVGGTITK
jgi:hypothetical protein